MGALRISESRTDRYESKISKHVEDYEQTPVSDDVKKDVLLQILPKSLESAIKDAMMHYEKDETEMDYEFVKSLVLQRVDREAAPEDDDPMDVDNVKDDGSP